MAEEDSGSDERSIGAWRSDWGDRKREPAGCSSLLIAM
jgi:hypothetical protein